MSSCYELTLTPDYVKDWTFNMAVRELIQNGIDQETVDAKNKFRLEYADGTLKFISPRSKLKINTLLLGRSSKQNNEETIGQFGEGYKIAALVLNRLGKTFTVYNYEAGKIWTSRFKNSRKWLDKILAFYVDDYESDQSGLVIEVGNVTEDEYAGLCEIWLGLDEELKSVIHTSYGDILKDEKYKGKVFINGLYIECNAEFSYGYNFKPAYITLERDRKTCDSWNARTITSKMLAESVLSGEIEFDECKKLLCEDDINMLTYTENSPAKKVIVEKLVESFEKANVPFSVPVYSDTDYRAVSAYGGNPVIVPYQVSLLLEQYRKDKISELYNRESEKKLSVKEQLQRWYDIYNSSLTFEMGKELKEIINQM